VEAEELMGATGRVVRVPEKQQDAVTAISGSGPAYIFFVVESMIEAGVHLGLPRATATELVIQVPEKQQDAVTAISGSGPAYIFFVVESMIEAGVHLGLPRATATELVIQ